MNSNQSLTQIQEATMYRIFTRTWWKSNSSWPGGREPHMGRKYTIATAHTEEAARDIARV
jgi:hypothetical protein